MSQTKSGAAKATKILYERYGKNYFKEMGRKGGKVCVPKGFSENRERASWAGRLGGLRTKRKKSE